MNIAHSIIPRHETLPRDESAANNDATTSARLIPGDTDTVTIFERWTFSLTTGMVWELTLVRGTCEPEGRASNTRCKCLMRTAVRRARWPSMRNNDDGFVGLDVENARAAAA